MKGREVIVWALLVVAIILLINQCGGDNNPADPVDTVYVEGRTDTVIHVDTVVVSKVVTVPKPYAVYVSGDSVKDVVCDSVRLYADTISTEQGMASVQSTVRGELINQSMSIEVYGRDSSFTRVDTIIETYVIPYDYTLSLAASVDLNNGPSVGVQIGLKRWSVAYQYFPMNKSNLLMVGYRLFHK